MGKPKKNELESNMVEGNEKTSISFLKDGRVTVNTSILVTLLTGAVTIGTLWARFTGIEKSNLELKITIEKTNEKLTKLTNELEVSRTSSEIKIENLQEQINRMNKFTNE
ncbi:MAG TPA: hypothetical protein DCE41_01270 [Cytophagales bacterium]|nr:hypothetical protein [Cytophagales bacterium]